jgi:hypothetical protein
LPERFALKLQENRKRHKKTIILGCGSSRALMQIPLSWIFETGNVVDFVRLFRYRLRVKTNFAPTPPIVGTSGDIICSYTSSRVSLAHGRSGAAGRSMSHRFRPGESLKCQVETIAIRVSAAPGLRLVYERDKRQTRWSCHSGTRACRDGSVSCVGDRVTSSIESRDRRCRRCCYRP